MSRVLCDFGFASHKKNFCNHRLYYNLYFYFLPFVTTYFFYLHYSVNFIFCKGSKSTINFILLSENRLIMLYRHYFCILLYFKVIYSLFLATDIA